MNAYELADKLQTIRKSIWYDIDHVVAKFVDETTNESAIMLRQQADQLDKVIPQLVKANGLVENFRIRIAELEKDNKRLHSIAQTMGLLESDARKSLQNVKDYKMNRPIAWYAEKFSGEMVFATSKAERWHLEDKGLEVIPLYTHPVKQLSDEEIVSFYESSYLQSGLDEWEFDPVYFARAIIKEITE